VTGPHILTTDAINAVNAANITVTDSATLSVTGAAPTFLFSPIDVDAKGDFNGGGFSGDILFQNKNTGQVSVWEMHGTSLIGGGPVSANPGTSWHAIGTGAGGSDILLQNTSGQTSIWEMNGNTIAGGGAVSPNPGPSWHAIGLT
jgi:hypothetical protein